MGALIFTDVSAERSVENINQRIKTEPDWFITITFQGGCMMETIKIVAKLAEEESKAKSNARVYTVDQARHRMSRQEGDSNLSSSEDGTRVVPRELLRNTKRKTTR